MKYFQLNGQIIRPLPNDTGNYDDLISLWMSHCAALAYESKAKISEELKQVGFNQVTFFEFSGTQAYFAEHHGNDSQIPFCVLAFRGTENDYKDIFADATVFKRTIDEDKKLRVHGGFLSALRNVWGSYFNPTGVNTTTFKADRVGNTGISDVLDKRAQKNSPLYITGHSLGGALATLAAYDFNRLEAKALTALYTYGSPRVASTDFSKYVNRAREYPIYRIVNSADIVPRVPPLLWGFRHVGEYIYLKRNGNKITGSLIKTFLDVGYKQTAVLIIGLLLVQRAFYWTLNVVSDPGLVIEVVANGIALIGAALTFWFLFILLPKILVLLPFSFLKWWQPRVFTDHAIGGYCTKLANLLK